MSSQSWEMQKENIVLFCFYNEPRWFLFVRLYWLAVWVMSENTREELSAVFELLTLWHCNQLSYLLISITGPIPLSLLNNKHECWVLGWRGGEGRGRQQKYAPPPPIVFIVQLQHSSLAISIPGPALPWSPESINPSWWRDGGFCASF